MKYVILNHKMNLTYEEIIDYVDKLKELKLTNINLITCPSSIYLSMFKDLNVACQNVSSFEKGSYTGELAAYQLKSLGIKYSLVGHSERRQYFNEDNLIVNKKIINLLKNDIKPILCIGETLEAKKLKKTGAVLIKQLRQALKDVSVDDLKKVIIAYEPVWSIGTGVIPSPNEIDEVVDYIKDTIYRTYNLEIPVLYGGSINDENISLLEKCKNIEGYLIGGASLDINKITNIINQI